MEGENGTHGYKMMQTVHNTLISQDDIVLTASTKLYPWRFAILVAWSRPPSIWAAHLLM